MVAGHRPRVVDAALTRGLPTPQDLGEGRLVLGIPNGRPQKVLRVDATGAPSTLLGRLLVGSYITGQDQVLLTARGGLTAEQRGEVRRVVDHLLGMTIVSETVDGLEVENFLDPSKHQLPHLLRRVVDLVGRELAICHAALVGSRRPELDRIDALEEEIDQLYLLMARQLLLSSDDSRIAHDIDVVSHHYQVGYRLVAKALEVTGDLIEGVARELAAHRDGLRAMPRPLPGAIALRLRRTSTLLQRTMNGFSDLSVVAANTTLNQIGEILSADTGFPQQLARRVRDPKVASSAQRIALNLAMALEMLVIVNEVTINRSVEPETVARTENRVVSSWAHNGDPTPPDSARPMLRTPGSRARSREPAASHL